MRPTHFSTMRETLTSSRREGLGRLLVLTGLALTALTGLAPQALAKPDSFTFNLTTSAGALGCLPNAQGEVRLSSRGENQVMDVHVTGLPPNNTFTVFVLQLPHSPFGLSWYQGDVVTDDTGEGHARFIGIFSDETFIVAPGPGPAPVIHPADGSTNPATPPIHTFHLGMWFDSVDEAVAARCPATQTPFNGDHTAGIQVMNTTNFADDNGPIGQFAP